MNAAHPKYSAARAPGHEHIPLYPAGFIALRIVQLVLAVLLLALGAYGVYVYPLSSILLTLVVVCPCNNTSLVTHDAGLDSKLYFSYLDRPSLHYLPRFITSS